MKQSDTPSAPDVAGNASYAMFAKVFYLTSRLLVPPLVLAHISLAEYGLWSACFVLIMYIGLTDVGFSSVYVRFVARFHAQGDLNSINRLLSTGVLTLSLMAVLVWLGLWLLLPHILDFLKVDPHQRGTASILVLGATAMFLFDLSLGAYCYLLHGLQRIREEQRVAIIGYALELLLIFAFLMLGLGVYSLLAAFVLRYLWSLSAFIRLAHRYLPGLEVRARHFDRAMLRHFFSFGLPVQASALIGTALFSLDRVVAGFLLGPKGIALFELGAKLPVAAISVPSAISNVTMPAAARLASSDDLSGIRELHQKTSRAICMLAGFPLAFMALFATPISDAWIGPHEELAQLPLILTLTALWSHLHITTGPGSAVYRAMGRVGNEFVYHTLRITCVGSGIGLALLGIESTATALIAGLASGSALAALLYLTYNQRRLGLPVRSLLPGVLLPGMTGYPIAALLITVWPMVVSETSPRWEKVAALLLFGMLYSAILAWVTWRVVLQPAERARVSQLLAPYFAPFMKRRGT